MNICGRQLKLGVLAALFLLVTWSVPSRAQDPVKVAAKNYKVIEENDQVRILDVRLAPAEKTAMHAHPDLIGVVLDPGKIKWTKPDGTSIESGPDFKRGGVQVMNMETHVSENIGKTTAHVILVEFKKPVPPVGQAKNPMLPAPFKQIADSPHARVYELIAAPGLKVPEHTHGNHVIVSLTNAAAELTTAGKKEPMTFKKDSAQYGGPVTHSGVNTGKTSLHLIEIELK